MRLCFPFLRPVRFFSPVYSFLYNSFVCFLFFSVSATYGGESESVRKGCFSGVAEFAKSVSVSLGETDENLKILKSILRSEYVWVVDSTPSKNSDYYLLRRFRTGEYCPVLKTKGYTIKERKRGDKEFVTVKTQGSGSVSTLELYYILNRGGVLFRLRRCEESRTGADGKTRRFRIECPDAVSDL